MKVGDTHIYRARNTITKPICIARKNESFSIWIDESGEVTGILRHFFRDGGIIDVEGAGCIPAEYVAVEENSRLW